jgi:hypothetical protein
MTGQALLKTIQSLMSFFAHTALLTVVFLWSKVQQRVYDGSRDRAAAFSASRYYAGNIQR